MEEVRGPSEGHPLQGPHRGLRPEAPPGFVPLGLVLKPTGLSIEVQRPEVIVGRHSQAEVRFGLPDVSRRHCRLVFENHQWRVYDLNSLNGVFVNGERMREATLYHGDHLQFGPLTFLVEHTLPVARTRDDGKAFLRSIIEVMTEQKRAS